VSPLPDVCPFKFQSFIQLQTIERERERERERKVRKKDVSHDHHIYDDNATKPD